MNALPCVDLRTAGKGYVIAPGGVTEAGRYDLQRGSLADLDALPFMPERLAAALRKPASTPSQEAAAAALAGRDPGPGWAVDHGRNRLSLRGRDRLERRIEGLASAIIRGVENAGPGTRHRAALNASRTMAGYAASYGSPSFEAIAAAVFQASVTNGHVAKDGERMTVLAIRAGIEDGAAHPLLLEERERGFQHKGAA